MPVTAAFIDRLVFKKGFASAMVLAGWLVGEDGTLSFPNFNRHNGTTAKARAETNRRVKNHRESNGNVTEKPLQKPLPEKRREEKSTEPTPAPSPSAPQPEARAVALPTREQAMEFAPSAAVTPDVAECWWHDCNARPLAPTGHFTDRNGAAIRNWHSSLTGYGRKWQANDNQRSGNRGGTRPRAAAPTHTSTDTEL